MSELRPGVHILAARADNPEESQPRPMKNTFLPLVLVAVACCALGYYLGTHRDRYQLAEIGGGSALGRLDKQTGEVVFLLVNGQEVSRYPAKAKPEQKP